MLKKNITHLNKNYSAKAQYTYFRLVCHKKNVQQPFYEVFTMRLSC